MSRKWTINEQIVKKVFLYADNNLSFFKKNLEQ